MKIEKEKTNTGVEGLGTTLGNAAPNDVLTNNIAHPVFTISGSTDDELRELAQEPLFQMYASVGPEIYVIISRTNPTLKAVIDLAKDICQGDRA